MMVKSGTFYPVPTIVGKDLSLAGTFNSDVVAGQGLIPAGRFMSYDEGAKELTAWNGDPEDIFGLLAFEVDASNTETNVPGMVYRAGTFLRQEIEAANQVVIPPNGPVDMVLRGLGILLEWSYEDYASTLQNPPPDHPPVAQG